MGQPAAKQNDTIVAVDTHIVMVPSPGGPVPTPLPHPFNGIISSGLSGDVNIMGFAAATVGSVADNTPPHIPTPPGTAFQTPPKNKGTIRLGSQTVKINGKSAARNGDVADTCNDPADAPVGKVIAVSTVMIGG
ncbi:MAG TPA: PAAR domain-containing protein [Planctomycetaceae bacterium]|nr:PAAR domain-containing protein [Planctomycetaceae bacterium]HRA89122.1 PAAR domain-containing protein [Planctomycetaceae bacterium]